MRADLGMVVGAVVSAFHARDLGPGRERAGEPHGEHRRLGSGVAEPNRVQAGHPLTQERCELDLDRVRRREPRAARGLPADRLHDFRMRMAEDHRGVVAEHVDALGAVCVPDATALPAVYVEGIGVEVRGRSRRASRHDPDSSLVDRSR